MNVLDQVVLVHYSFYWPTDHVKIKITVLLWGVTLEGMQDYYESCNFLRLRQEPSLFIYVR